MDGYQKRYTSMLCRKMVLALRITLAIFLAVIVVVPAHIQAQQIPTPPQPVVAIHVSELTQALEAIPNGWWTAWHYFVMPESIKEALRSDGTPFIEVSDADIAAGALLYPMAPRNILF
jgi:hypothetical protein